MQRTFRTPTLLSRVLGICTLAILGALTVLSPAWAQEVPETPGGTPEQTPTATASTGTSVFLEVEAPTGEPVHDGDTFFVHIVVSDVEHLSAFDFQLGYDRERVEPVRQDEGEDATPAVDGELGVEGGDELVAGELGQFLEDSPRGALCTGPFIRPSLENRVLGLCAGVALPVCLGGLPGVDGAGRLGTVEFKSKGGDMTEISLVQANLVSDDVAPPCDPTSDDFSPISIEHTIGPSVTVLLSGGGGMGILLIAIIAIVVVVALGAGLGGFLLYQRRTARP